MLGKTGSDRAYSLIKSAADELSFTASTHLQALKYGGTARELVCAAMGGELIIEPTQVGQRVFREELTTVMSLLGKDVWQNFTGLTPMLPSDCREQLCCLHFVCRRTQQMQYVHPTVRFLVRWR